MEVEQEEIHLAQRLVTLAHTCTHTNTSIQGLYCLLQGLDGLMDE